jgi:spore coat protein CotF
MNQSKSMGAFDLCAKVKKQHPDLKASFDEQAQDYTNKDVSEICKSKKMYKRPSLNTFDKQNWNYTSCFTGMNKSS